MPNITPFFQAFGPLLFGRGPRSLIKKIKRLDGLGELHELFGELPPDSLLSMNEAGVNSRERILTPKVTFWAFYLPSSRRGQCVPRCRAQGGGMVALDAQGSHGRLIAESERLCQARARLDLQTLRLIHGHLAWSLSSRLRHFPWRVRNRFSKARYFNSSLCAGISKRNRVSSKIKRFSLRLCVRPLRTNVSSSRIRPSF